MAQKLSRVDLEGISAVFIKLYNQLPERKGGPVDPVTLARDVLGLNVLTLPLCQDGSILGLSVFADKVEIELHLDDGTSQIMTLSGKDVVIDAALTEKKQRGRFNYTLAHEIAHYILFWSFPQDYPKVACRTHIKRRSSMGHHDWEEWQADIIAAALLMPEDVICRAMWVCGVEGKIEILNALYRKEEYKRFCNMAEYLGVSKQALMIKMKGMGLIGREYLRRPNDMLRILREDADDTGEEKSL